MNIKIADKVIGDSEKVFIIAEVSGNHNKSIDRAKAIIMAGKNAGADAVKLQTYTADSITLNSKKDFFRTKKNGLWANQTLYELYTKASTPYEWHKELKEYADSLGLILFSSPFDTHAVDFLDEMGMPCYKVASFEINDIMLIKYIAMKMKPIIISTGVATLDDINEAIETCKSVGNEDIILLKCTSEYPTPIDEVNLMMIPDMMKRFGTVVGLSDHTLGKAVAIASVAMGARVIEKHLTLDEEDTVDSAFSLKPHEFKEMVDDVRLIERALGKVDYSLTASQKGSLAYRRSLFSSANIKKGEKFTENNIKSVRPHNGLSTKYYDEIIGKTATKDIDFATPLTEDMIDGFKIINE